MQYYPPQLPLIRKIDSESKDRDTSAPESPTEIKRKRHSQYFIYINKNKILIK